MSILVILAGLISILFTLKCWYIIWFVVESSEQNMFYWLAMCDIFRARQMSAERGDYKSQGQTLCIIIIRNYRLQNQNAKPNTERSFFPLENVTVDLLRV